MKLLLDEMLSAVIAERLRGQGHDVIAVVERHDLRGLPDAELFSFAQADERAVVTYNREDFLSLDREFRSLGREHHGVVLVHPRRFLQRAATIAPLVMSIAGFVERGSPYPGFVHWLQ